jgi:hypothetical protein
MQSVIIHLTNEDPVEAEMEALPTEHATCIVFSNPRKRDGKNVGWATGGARYFIFPMTRVHFIEVMTSREEEGKVIKHFRE